MCGICGVWGQVEPKVIENMIAVMHHRGPDDRGMIIHSCAALGMTRLAIQDPSMAAHQPMSNSDQTVWIVYNGEVYNFKEERRFLEAKGHRFTSGSDTEVILRLYECYGDDFLLRLRGMFAIAVFDFRKGPGRERLLLARDPIGIKPLLYRRVGSRLVFASELKAILASGIVEREIEPDALRTLITYGSVRQPQTMVKDVKMLLPAHRLIIDGDSARIEPYWHFEVDRIKGLRKSNYDELVEQLAEQLENTVRLQMISDVPVGAFLSGGVDSTLLVGLMSKISGSQIKTFSIGFNAADHGVDETDASAKTASFLGTEHLRVAITGNDVHNQLEHFICSMDQPSVDGLNSYFVSYAAHNHVKVAISGTGGDELFAGYPWFAEMTLFDHKFWDQQPWHTRSLHRIFGNKFLGGLKAREKYHKTFLSNFGNAYNIFGTAGAEQLIETGFLSQARMGLPFECEYQAIDELPLADVIDRVSALCLRGYTNNQLLRDIDALSMAHSLEIRVPLLDISLINFALSLPFWTKIQDPQRILNLSAHEATYRQLGSKRILIDAGKRLNVLPPDIDLQPKRGFTLPVHAWLKGSLREIFDDTFSEQSIKRRGLFKLEPTRQVYQDFLEDKIHWTRPWLLMVTELWARSMIDIEA